MDTLEMLIKSGILTDEDVEKAEFLKVEEELVRQKVDVPKISHRQKGSTTQYYLVVPKRYSKTGERHQITGYSEAEVQKAFKKEAYYVLTKQADEEFVDHLTVQDVVKMYLNSVSPSKTTRGRLKKTTAEKYMRVYKNYIEEKDFGLLKAKNVKLYHCEDFVQMLYDRRITKEYASQIKSLVKSAFDYAIGRDYMDKNYMTSLRINASLCSTENCRETGVWEDEEVITICRCSYELWKQEEYRQSAVLPLMIFLGCRIGELLAATWDDVDFEAKTLRLDKTVIEYTDYKLHKKIREVDTPKTPESKRIISLTDAAVYWLREIEKRNKQCGLTGKNILQTQNGRIPKEANILDTFKRFCKRIGVPYKASHSCRKTYVTIMIDGGIPVPQVAKDVGHKKITTTQNIYYKCRNQGEATMEKKNSVISGIFGNLATPGNTPYLRVVGEKTP